MLYTSWNVRSGFLLAFLSLSLCNRHRVEVGVTGIVLVVWRGLGRGAGPMLPLSGKIELVQEQGPCPSVVPLKHCLVLAELQKYSDLMVMVGTRSCNAICCQMKRHRFRDRGRLWLQMRWNNLSLLCKVMGWIAQSAALVVKYLQVCHSRRKNQWTLSEPIHPRLALW